MSRVVALTALSPFVSLGLVVEQALRERCQNPLALQPAVTVMAGRGLGTTLLRSHYRALPRHPSCLWHPWQQLYPLCPSFCPYRQPAK